MTGLFWFNIMYRIERNKEFEMSERICHLRPINLTEGFLDGSVVMNPLANAEDAGDRGSIPGSGGSPGEGNGNSLQCSCLENSMDRGYGSVGRKESDMTKVT